MLLLLLRKKSFKICFKNLYEEIYIKKTFLGLALRF